MPITVVLSACDTNPTYTQYVPLFLQTWRRVSPNMCVFVVLVADKIPSELEPCSEHLILFPPIPGVPTAFTAQYVRLLYPGLLEHTDGAVVITDIDMVPLKPSYWDVDAQPGDFCVLTELPAKNQIAMCYCAAEPSVWADVFQIQDICGARSKLKDVSTSLDHTSKDAWYTDQQDLFRCVIDWNKQIEHLRKPLSRLDRVDDLCPSLFARIRLQEFDDFHMFRRDMCVNRTLTQMATDLNALTPAVFPPTSLISPH